MKMIEVIAQIRAKLEEYTPRQFDDSELLNWVNEGARKMSLVAQNLLEETDIAVTANSEYTTAPADCLVIDDAYWVFTSDSTRYPLSIAQRRDMWTRWGTYQASMTGIPNSLAISGQTPPKLTFYPIPQSAGTLTLFYRRLAATVLSGSGDLDVETGWDHVAINFAVAEGFTRAQDTARAQYYFNLYQQDLGLLVAVTDQQKTSQQRGISPSYYDDSFDYSPRF